MNTTDDATDTTSRTTVETNNGNETHAHTTRIPHAQQRKPAMSYVLYFSKPFALSTQRQLTLLEHMYRMANDGSQFIVATHSPILLGLPDAEILSFDENGVHPCDYEDTDSYQITRVFINHRESVLRHLLEDET